MADVYEIPLVNTPQRFGITLLGVNYVALNRWNAQSEIWEFSLMDADGTPILSSMPLVTGTDLLMQHRHLINASLICYTEGDELQPPTLDSLGQSSKVFFIV